MTRKQPNNPFLLSGYISPDYFCDRENETKKLTSALYNGRNVTLMSPRRMGKTGLIHHVFNRVETANEANCFYVDLYQTDSLASLVRKLGQAVLGKLDTTEQRVIKKIATFFKSLRPVISVDAVTGEPEFSVAVEPDMAEHSLAEIFAYMEQAEKRCYIAFDEFQSVADYSDKRVEALLRAHIQHLTNVNFIFSGSQQHTLENMFATVSRPFYQSTQMLTLGTIDRDAYYTFANAQFGQNGQQITLEAFNHLYDELSAHTWYVQSILNRLYETNNPVIDTVAVNMAIDETVAENEATFQTFLQLITPLQAKIMKAIAHEGNIEKIQSKDFIQKHNLGAASSVKTGTTALVEKELLLSNEHGYCLYDRFFAQYLRKMRQ